MCREGVEAAELLVEQPLDDLGAAPFRRDRILPGHRSDDVRAVGQAFARHREQIGGLREGVPGLLLAGWRHPREARDMRGGGDRIVMRAAQEQGEIARVERGSVLLGIGDLGLEIGVVIARRRRPPDIVHVRDRVPEPAGHGAAVSLTRGLPGAELPEARQVPVLVHDIEILRGRVDAGEHARARLAIPALRLTPDPMRHAGHRHQLAGVAGVEEHLALVDAAARGDAGDLRAHHIGRGNRLAEAVGSLVALDGNDLLLGHDRDQRLRGEHRGEHGERVGGSAIPGQPIRDPAGADLERGGEFRGDAPPALGVGGIGDAEAAGQHPADLALRRHDDDAPAAPRDGDRREDAARRRAVDHDILDHAGSPAVARLNRSIAASAARTCTALSALPK